MARTLYPIQWSKAVTDSDLSGRERLVCYALHVHMDVRGICRPTLKTICRRSGYGPTSVKEALNLLEGLGWITRSRGSTGRANVYAGLIPRLTHSRPRPTRGWSPQSGPQEYREEERTTDDDEFGGF